jgi:hypothetical protein
VLVGPDDGAVHVVRLPGELARRIRRALEHCEEPPPDARRRPASEPAPRRGPGAEPLG